MDVTTELSYGRPVRCWVNEPSTLQPDHEFHGKVGIAIPAPGPIVEVFFCDGPVISTHIEKLYLSPGRPREETCKTQ